MQDETDRDGFALIGRSGFVGSTLLRQTSFDHCYRSTDIGESAGRRFETVVCAAAPAQKWIANQHPVDDRANIDRLIASLERISCGTFVLISTVDVFGVPVDVDEDSPVVEDNLHAYGLHRRVLERFVETHFDRHLIVRLPGLVGPGLRKNVIFDFLHENNLHAIDSRGVFQFYPMFNLWYDIQTALSGGLKLVHLTSEPIQVADVSALGFGRSFERVLDAKPGCYDMKTKHAALFGSDNPHYQYRQREVVQAVRAYAQSEPRSISKLPQGGGKMRLAISNIAWDVAEDALVAVLLQRYGLDAVDLAPSKYFADPLNADPESIHAVRRWWNDRGFEVTGMQSLLFGTNGLNLFGVPDVRKRMLDHLDGICRIGEVFGASRLVFGSPRNRDRSGLDDATAHDIAVEFFSNLGALAAAHGVTICLEPNPARYGANFMLTSNDTAAVVRAVDHPAIRMQLDIGSLSINNEAPGTVLSNCASLIGHIHASEPDLVPLGDAQTDHSTMHRQAQAFLPRHVVCIEMLATPNEPHPASIERALRVATSTYGREAVDAVA